jgi:6-pyruvoyltetrahydropterin/6-carboxytetrahydropterin synthase
MMYVSNRARFSASHRLHNPALSDEENRRLFGLCNNPNGHGHDYEIEVVVRGEPDPRTGMVVNLSTLKELLETWVVGPARYRSLDDGVPFMKGRLSTTENVALGIWEELAPRIPSGELHLVRVRESENNVIEYTGPDATSRAQLPAGGIKDPDHG